MQAPRRSRKADADYWMVFRMCKSTHQFQLRYLEVLPLLDVEAAAAVTRGGRDRSSFSQTSWKSEAAASSNWIRMG